MAASGCIAARVPSTGAPVSGRRASPRARGSSGTRARRSRSRSGAARRGASAGSPSGRRSRRGARGASRCGTARGRSGRASVCRTVCVVRRRSFERCMPPCSAIERSRLMTRHTVRIRREPQDEVHPRVTERDADRDEHELHADDAPGLRTHGRRRSSVHAAQQALEQLAAGAAGRVAGELAAHRRRGRWGSRGRAGCRARRGRTRRGGAPCGRGGRGRSA